MLAFRFSLYAAQRNALNRRLKAAQSSGNLRLVKHILALLSLADGSSPKEVSSLLRVSEESLRQWMKEFLLKGVHSLVSKKSPGRPSNLTKSQKRELGRLIQDGPQQCGYSAGCWRSPMIQHLIYQRFGVFYSMHYISQLLRNMGFSYQKARFVSDHLDEAKRKEWIESTWPEILKLAKEKGAWIMFGDEASFPQWGTLSYTWARKGDQPTVKTSGKRKAIKVFGLIEYYSGRFIYKTTEGRFNSESYKEFLKEVLSKTRKHIILIQDGARYHTSKATREFFEENKERITVKDLPSYSPDYNPIEKLWKKIKQEETHMHYFPTYESLVEKVEEAMVKFGNARKEVLALFGFYEKLAAA